MEKNELGKVSTGKNGVTTLTVATKGGTITFSEDKKYPNTLVLEVKDTSGRITTYACEKNGTLSSHQEGASNPNATKAIWQAWEAAKANGGTGSSLSGILSGNALALTRATNGKSFGEFALTTLAAALETGSKEPLPSKNILQGPAPEERKNAQQCAQEACKDTMIRNSLRTVNLTSPTASIMPVADAAGKQKSGHFRQ